MATLHQLFFRVVVNVLVGITDDHTRILGRSPVAVDAGLRRVLAVTVNRRVPSGDGLRPGDAKVSTRRLR